MAERRKIPRLGQAAREFNVGMSSIVSLLKKRDIEILENPNIKLTEEMYDIVVKEFQGDKKDKEKADQIGCDLGHTKAKTEETVEESVSMKSSDSTATPEEDEIIQPVKEPQIEPFKTTQVGIKIVGEVDLETIKTKKTEKKEKAEKEEKKSSPSKDKTKKSKKEISGSEIEVETDQTVTKEDKTIESEKVVEPEQKIEHFKADVPTIDVTVIDKIELEETNKKGTRKTKKADKTPEQQSIEETSAATLESQASVEEAAVESEAFLESATTEKPAATSREVEHIHTNVEILRGLKIVGTMSIPETRVKEDTKKTPEKEKDKSKESVSGEATPKKTEKKRKRIRKPASASARTSHSTSTSASRKAEANVKTEISSEEIEKQLRDTLQRMSSTGKSQTSKHKRRKRQHTQAEIIEQEKLELAEQKHLKIPEFITINELATLMEVQVTKLIETCLTAGIAVAINQRLDAVTISLLADEFGFQVTFVGIDMEDEKDCAMEDDPKDLVPRHPIIAVMGHVDHGKTSLLDYIRKANVIAGEAGGITQHIGAYEVQIPDGRKITFLDTPGHEAFTAMRARGAKVTDLSIIVIAADDAIMPQTVEAINHAQAAGVPMVFAITKIDKPHANPEKIKEGLANMNLLVEDWGGKYQCQEINAKHGTNVNELLEKVLLEAELLELKANPNRPGRGTVIESSLDKGRGYVAKILVQNGTLRHGDSVVAGSCYGKVKALHNERNQRVKKAIPSTPVLMLGLNGAPQAGDIFRVCASEHEARVSANKRQQLVREMGIRTQKHITLEEIGRRLAIGDFKELNLIVKADVDGSAEALANELLKLSTEQVQVNVIHKSVGQVTDTDVMLASASNAIIVAFQVRPSPSSRKLAEQEQIDIRIYSIIYKAINEIKDAIEGMHTPEIHEKILSNLEIKEVYKIGKVGNIAGCLVLDGKLQKNTKVRLIRDGIVIYTGKLGSLKRYKDDVKEVIAGQECGLNIENFDDVKVGDIIEGYEEYEVKVTL